MTCRDMLIKEHPEMINESWFGGCRGCPNDYGYMNKPTYCRISEDTCGICWNRTIPEEDKNNEFSFDKIKELIDYSIEKNNRQVHIFIHPKNGVSINISPWPDAEELYEQYSNGRITENDFRSKIGLNMIKNAGKFMKK